MSLFPDEDVLTREIETWRGFIEKLPSDEDKAILTKLLNDCYEYSLAMNNHAQEHPFPRVGNHVIVINTAQTYQSIKVDDTIWAAESLRNEL